MTKNTMNHNECVILLHGLARSSSSLNKLEKALLQHGYKTVNDNYPSTSFDIPTLAQNVISGALSQCSDCTKVHFVTHSMGGILVRQYLSQHDIANLGRVIMLGPPNQGSQVVDTLKHVPGFKFINGLAGFQLGTDDKSIPLALGKADFELGIIAGTRSINLILSAMLPGPDDGKVSVENTKLEGMADHITLPVTHPLMMANSMVIEEVLHFLRCGSFSRLS